MEICHDAVCEGDRGAREGFTANGSRRGAIGSHIPEGDFGWRRGCTGVSINRDSTSFVRCSVVERARNQKGLANRIRQCVLGFVPVARSNKRVGHSLISIIRLHIRLAEPDFERSRVSCETGAYQTRSREFSRRLLVCD